MNDATLDDVARSADAPAPTVSAGEPTAVSCDAEFVVRSSIAPPADA